DPSEQRAPDGPHDEAGGERAESREQRGRRVAGRKEVSTYLSGEEPEQGEVGPFQYVAHDAGCHTAAWHGPGSLVERWPGGPVATEIAASHHGTLELDVARPGSRWMASPVVGG